MVWSYFKRLASDGRIAAGSHVYKFKPSVRDSLVFIFVSGFPLRQGFMKPCCFFFLKQPAALFLTGGGFFVPSWDLKTVTSALTGCPLSSRIDDVGAS